MDVRDDNDIDYILQVISNGTRRRILKLLADEAPLTYTKIMQKLNIKDSGTLGFHLKKMARLLRRDEFGEYKLSSLGWRALDIMKRLEGIEISEYEEASEEERKSRVFSDQLRFEYTRSLAEKLRGEGVKAIITDIITLIIHPMDRKLFDETVESISDVLTCYVPEDLYDDVVMKSSDV
ncbi:TPA: ArsR family transcriptional regulator, partial [Candidatus Geothermarchaeota archaeon]|nr:ArsR family transcriptional regulator [Candidatus Geothermarchaeota archaeon]